ncbi:hypothetical protein BI291_02965 [Thalassotalea sp. PP2-459]|nr:hypothetical protein BI291_02965 [Thalassotalea sp. PP2-459]
MIFRLPSFFWGVFFIYSESIGLNFFNVEQGYTFSHIGAIAIGIYLILYALNVNFLKWFKLSK